MMQEPSGWQEVWVAGSRIRVSVAEPIAVVRRAGMPDLAVAWSDLPVGLRHPEMRVAAAPGGVWVFYSPVEAEDDAAAEEHAAAVHVSPSGAVTRFPDLTGFKTIGATRHGLWLTADAWPADPDDHAAWLDERGVLVLGSDGTRHSLVLDRLAVFAWDSGETAHLVVYASAPAQHRASLGGIGYSYRHLQLDLPPGELPANLRIGECATTFIGEHEVVRVMNRCAPQAHPPKPGDPRAWWDLVDLSPAERQAAVDAVCAEFANLDSYWHGDDGSVIPLATGLRNPRVEVAGDWPFTRVEVSFKHPHYPSGRLRRTLRVFDDGGRVASTQYASIHLMEDLDTGALPPAADARDGILEI